LPEETTSLGPFKLPKQLIKFGGMSFGASPLQSPLTDALEEEVLRHAKTNEYDLDEADEAFLAQAKEYAGEEGAPAFRFTADTLERIIDYFEKESFQQVEQCDGSSRECFLRYCKVVKFFLFLFIWRRFTCSFSSANTSK
jgi:hypothetical protein